MRLGSGAYHAILGAAALLGAALAALNGVAPAGTATPAARPGGAPAARPDAGSGAGRSPAGGTATSGQAGELPTGPRDDDAPGFHAIGSAPCRTCHRAIWQAWERTGHASAAEALDFDQRLSPDCQPCHLPYDEVESGVGCEACHGPGSAYAALAVMIDPYKRQRAGLENARAGCADCHNPGHPFHRERDLEAAGGQVHRVPPASAGSPGRR